MAFWLWSLVVKTCLDWASYQLLCSHFLHHCLQGLVLFFWWPWGSWLACVRFVMTELLKFIFAVKYVNAPAFRWLLKWVCPDSLAGLCSTDNYYYYFETTLFPWLCSAFIIMRDSYYNNYYCNNNNYYYNNNKEETSRTYWKRQLEKRGKKGSGMRIGKWSWLDQGGMMKNSTSKAVLPR